MSQDEYHEVPFKPNVARVNNVAAALEAVTQLDKNLEPPVWLSDQQEPPPVEYLACGNGLLHLPTGKLRPPTPKFFGLSASEGDLEKLPARPVVGDSGVNADESKREQSGIIRSQFRGNQGVMAFFEVP